MGDDEKSVKAVYPEARIVWNSDRQRFKVYRHLRDCSVALSSSWETQGMAWADAAKGLKEKGLQIERKNV